jgi:hypothetical protein
MGEEVNVAAWRVVAFTGWRNARMAFNFILSATYKIHPNGDTIEVW